MKQEMICPGKYEMEMICTRHGMKCTRHGMKYTRHGMICPGK
jgi:hypothetical protein